MDKKRIVTPGIIVVVIIFLGLVVGAMYSSQSADKAASDANSGNNLNSQNGDEVFSFENSGDEQTGEIKAVDIADLGAKSAPEKPAEEKSATESKYEVVDLKISAAGSAGGSGNPGGDRGAIFKTEISDTPALQRQGLSGRNSIGENQAMLFVFKENNYHSFWMKDMNFSIDMIWINESKQIVHIEKNVSPDSYPKTFQSPTLAKYVLEVQAGAVKKRGIKVGDSVSF